MTRQKMIMTRAVAFATASQTPYNNLGLLLMKMNRADESQKAFNKSIEINPYFTGKRILTAASLCITRSVTRKH